MRQIFRPEGKGSLMFFSSTEASYCRLKGIAATEKWRRRRKFEVQEHSLKPKYSIRTFGNENDNK